MNLPRDLEKWREIQRTQRRQRGNCRKLTNGSPCFAVVSFGCPLFVPFFFLPPVPRRTFFDFHRAWPSPSTRLLMLSQSAYKQSSFDSFAIYPFDFRVIVLWFLSSSFDFYTFFELLSYLSPFDSLLTAFAFVSMILPLFISE